MPKPRVRAIRVKWEMGVRGQLVLRPYSNMSLTNYALVTTAQLAQMRKRRGEYLNLEVLDRNVMADPDTMWSGL